MATGVEVVDLGGGVLEARLLVDVTGFWNTDPAALSFLKLDMFWAASSLRVA